VTSLGSEERLDEEARTQVLAHAGAAIGNGYFDVGTGLSVPNKFAGLMF